jgi:hypothetical protein
MSKSTLYIFFGKDESEQYLYSFEKVDLNNEKIEIHDTGKYHMIFGTVVLYENNIYFFGGKNEKGITNTSIKFNPLNNTIESGIVNLVQPAFFHQSNLLKIGEKCYGNFSLEDNSFIKFNIN